MNKLNLFSEYLTNKYGKVLYRVPIDLPLSCPNRERNGGVGCIYCAEDGNRARHLRNNFSLREQVNAGIDYIAGRHQNHGPYIAYFQSFTNTNAPVDTLRAWYEEVLAMADFKMVIIATRPDCLPDEVMKYLAELKERYELWVELGVQSTNDATLALIRRGHDFASVTDAVRRLDAAGIKTAAHVILGLPGENSGDYRQTAEALAALPFQAVKLHQLMILRKTPLASLLASGELEVKPLNEYEYAAAAVDFLRRLPDNWIVMRLMADAGNEAIIAPKWWMKKGQFIEYIKGLMNGSESEKVITGDGTPTLYHPEYRQHFHSVAGAATESREKFIIPSGLGERVNPQVLDIGFGLGYNAIAALEANPGAVITTLEKDRKALEAARELFDPASFQHQVISGLLVSCQAQICNKDKLDLRGNFFQEAEGRCGHRPRNPENKSTGKTLAAERLQSSALASNPPETFDSQLSAAPANSNQPRNLCNPCCKFEFDRTRTDGCATNIKLILGDARQSVREMKSEIFDVIFLDGFSPDTNPELWSYDFLRELKRLLKNDGILVTYSSAYPVRGALLRLGLSVTESVPFGRKRGGTAAVKSGPTSLDEKELAIIQKSTAGVPYRDPGLKLTAMEILERRNRLVKRLRSKGVPKWYKR